MKKDESSEFESFPEYKETMLKNILWRLNILYDMGVNLEEIQNIFEVSKYGSSPSDNESSSS